VEAVEAATLALVYLPPVQQSALWKRMRSQRVKGWVGHELGDGKYVLDLELDLVMPANLDGSKDFPADQQLPADPRFGPWIINRSESIRDPNSGQGGAVHTPDRRPAWDRELRQSSYGARLSGNDERCQLGTPNRPPGQLVIAPHGLAQFAPIPLERGTGRPHLMAREQRN
jgi:hypothetical protein